MNTSWKEEIVSALFWLIANHAIVFRSDWALCCCWRFVTLRFRTVKTFVADASLHYAFAQLKHLLLTLRYTTLSHS